MIIEINEKDRKALEEIYLRILEFNKINYGVEIEAHIINDKDKKNVSFKLNGIRF